MTPELLTEQLKMLFATVLELPADRITLELSPDNCAEWDSLRHIHLISAIDETFDVTLTFEQQMEIMTFDLAIDVVTEALNGASAG